MFHHHESNIPANHPRSHWSIIIGGNIPPVIPDRGVFSSGYKSNLTTGLLIRSDLRMGATLSLGWCGWLWPGMSPIRIMLYSLTGTVMGTDTSLVVLSSSWVVGTSSSLGRLLLFGIGISEPSTLIGRKWHCFLRVILLLPSTRTRYCRILGSPSTTTPVCCHLFFPCILSWTATDSPTDNGFFSLAADVW